MIQKAADRILGDHSEFVATVSRISMADHRMRPSSNTVIQERCASQGL
jgi:hypothetical protein